MLIFSRFCLALSLMSCSSLSLAVQQWQGIAAPEFRLQDQNGAWRSSADFRGQWLVLYFYPKDQTPGCSKEAANFRDMQAQYQALKARIVGISVDDVPSHKDFSDTLKLPFTLLADSGKSVSKAYDVLWEIGPLKIARRETFLINPDGAIAKHYAEVDPDSHAQTVLTDLKALQAAKP
ncbi:MAG: peroxiredoxin [Gammaproteobacteria bacterium]|nr:peroxiredoxin [Gammaproteobacteria bacterium]